MSKDVNDLTAALELAAVEDTGSTEESSTEVAAGETEEASTPEGEKTKPGRARGAETRIRELVDKTKGLEEELNSYKSAVGEKDKELGKLVDLLQARENDARVVKKIQELYTTDTKWKDTIEKLDKVIRGEEVEETETGSKTQDKSIEKAKDLIQSTRKELDEAIADQKADLLLHRSELLIDRYMSDLPAEYNDEDRRLLMDTLKHHIDWNAIEEDPAKLSDLVHKGVQNAVTWYGTPKGTMPKTQEKGSEKTMPESPQERLDKIMKLDYGKVKTVKTSTGGESKVPEMSDDDFVKLLGESIRLKNRGL